MGTKNLTAEEKALLADLLLDGEDFENLSIEEDELSVAQSLAEKKFITLHKELFSITASAYKTPLQRFLDFVENLEMDYPPTEELSLTDKNQILEKLKTKFGLD